MMMVFDKNLETISIVNCQFSSFDRNTSWQTHCEKLQQGSRNKIKKQMQQGRSYWSSDETRQDLETHRRKMLCETAQGR